MTTEERKSGGSNRSDNDAELEAAARETERILAADPERISDMKLPLNQYIARSDVENYRQAFEAGDTKALMDAIDRCALAGIAMPDWLADAFHRCYASVDHARVGSWDEAFGRPYKKGTHLAATRKKKQQYFTVFIVIGHLVWKNPGRAIDVWFFEDMGAILGCKATRAAELYYELKRENPVLFERYSRKPEI